MIHVIQQDVVLQLLNKLSVRDVGGSLQLMCLRVGLMAVVALYKINIMTSHSLHLSVVNHRKSDCLVNNSSG